MWLLCTDLSRMVLIVDAISGISLVLPSQVNETQYSCSTQDDVKTARNGALKGWRSSCKGMGIQLNTASKGVDLLSLWLQLSVWYSVCSEIAGNAGY